eukprot:GHVT01040908.1.p1 GENE.GHVT01040908.1~~GHVT01040908.1.p1  ORF type:complete len:143 (+),score=23.22 GHVT01040908.1:1767-2195(+)
MRSNGFLTASGGSESVQVVARRHRGRLLGNSPTSGGARGLPSVETFVLWVCISLCQLLQQFHADFFRVSQHVVGKPPLPPALPPNSSKNPAGNVVNKNFNFFALFEFQKLRPSGIRELPCPSPPQCANLNFVRNHMNDGRIP